MQGQPKPQWQPPQPPKPGTPPAQPKQAPAQTLYQILQVDHVAHPTIIRYAYRFLAGLYHPDNVDTGNPEMFRVVSEAFKTLSDTGKRAAYDLQVGSKLLGEAQHNSAAAASTGTFGSSTFGQNKAHFIPKTGLGYNEVELRLAVLQILLTARKKRTQTGGASAKVLMDVLGIEMLEMEFMLWYLREKGLIVRNEQAFQITVMGVDYIVDSLAKTQAIDDGGRTTRANDIQLPATLG